MNYGQNIGGSVTPIDSLPDLSEVDGVGQAPHPQGYQLARNPYVGENLPPDQADKYRRLVRQRHTPHPAAGMNSYNPPPEPQEENSMEYEPRTQQRPQMPGSWPISCIDIANHVKDCPICSKFYNNDKTVYIIVIVVLVIIVLLLLKKVLDV